MSASSVMRALIGGWAGGFAGNALLGALFSAPWVRRILYDPEVQSATFLALTPQRDIAVSVAGLVALSGIHGLLFSVLRPSIPGSGWVRKGVSWGVITWAMYWLFQEWFVYVTLLREPLPLAAVELAILLLGSLVEGLAIARILDGPESR